MVYLLFLFTLLFSSAVVLYFLPRILLLSLKNKILDKIDSRKVHSTAACRLGGASFLPAIVLSVIISSLYFTDFAPVGIDVELTRCSLLIICSSMILYFVGIYDDIVWLRYKEKFLFQFITAALVIGSGCYITDLNGLCGIGHIPGVVGIPLTFVLIVFITNAINLIDGIDGLASMLSMMAFIAYGVMFYLNGNYINCIFCVAALGALGPFWHHNVLGLRKGVKAKIFMGDGGALVIGFILSVMAVKLWNSTSMEGSRYGYISDYSWVIAFTMLIIPCFDVLRVMLHRVREHNSPFLPDKNHFHHKLMAFGLSARRSLVVLSIINVAFLVINYSLATTHIDITFIVVADVVIWVAMHIYLSRRIKLTNPE